MSLNPCLRCGACCAFFRASFYWSECDDATPGGVPAELTENLPPFRRVFKGTNQNHPRCIALQGEIGKEVACSIYERRASVCRDFTASYSNGQPNEHCDRARFAHGLPPLKPEDWISPEDRPEPDQPNRPDRPNDPGRLRPAA